MQGQTILCLSTRLWHSLWRNTQQIMSRLAETNRVIFVEPQRNPDLSYLADVRRSVHRLARLEVERIHDDLLIVSTPPALPYARQKLPRPVLTASLPIVAGINNALLAWHIRRVMRRLDVRQPVLWLYEPRQAGLVGRFGEKLTCYFVYDELADFPPNRRIRGLLRRYDEAMCRRADVVLASSQGQYQRRVAINPNTYCVPNGVDHALFSRALDAQTPLAPDMARLRRPVVGFVGWLGHQLDVTLLARVAETYPEYQLVLVGPDALERDEAYARLCARPNVHFTGGRPLDALPSYLKGFDVALLPYRMDSHAYAIYPLKLHEYLAAGCSVLATSMPELQPFADHVRIARDADEFLALLPQALADNGPSRRAQRSDLARLHTWDSRVALVHQALDRHLPQNPVERAGALMAHKAGH
jgi:hypothetical protein